MIIDQKLNQCVVVGFLEREKKKESLMALFFVAGIYFDVRLEKKNPFSCS